MIFDIILNDKASLVGKLIILPSYIEAFQTLKRLGEL